MLRILLDPARCLTSSCLRTDRFVDGPRERWKQNMRVLKAVIKYVKVARRFQPRAVVLEGVGEEAEVEGEIEQDDEAGGNL